MFDKQKKRALFGTRRLLMAAFLNLLVLPGMGTFLLHRRKAAWLQLLLSCSSLVLAFAGFFSLAVWASSGGLAGWDSVEFPLTGFEGWPLERKSLFFDWLKENPPQVFGGDLRVVLFVIVGLFFVSWVWSFLVLFFPVRRPKG